MRTRHCSSDTWRCHSRDQPSEHLYDADEQRAGASPRPVVHETAGAQQIEDGRALSRTAARHRIEAALVGRGATSTAFGDVQDDRDTGAIELIAKLGTATLRNELAGDGLELESNSVHVEFLGIRSASPANSGASESREGPGAKASGIGASFGGAAKGDPHK